MNKTVLTPYVLIPHSNGRRKFMCRWIAFLVIIALGFLNFTQAQPTIPKFQLFQPFSTANSAQPVQRQLPGQHNPILPRDTYTEQNYRIMQQAGMSVPGPTPAIDKRQQNEEVRKALKGDDDEGGEMSYASLSRHFQNNFQQFLQLNPNNFSITKAVYLSESAFYDNLPAPTYEQFEKSIKQVADLVRKILRQEGLSEKNNTAVMYAIQKLYSQSNTFYNPATGGSFTIERLHYDFDDFMGDRDWTKMFVTKVLQKGTGQCHSLPLFFLCIAEQLNAKAYLALAPNHSFIQYFDKKGNRYNFETTNGHLISANFLAQGTFITATALKNKTYLDTLSSRELYAQCLGDLLLGYLMKLKYDNITDRITKKILSIDSTNLTGLMLEANLRNYIFQDELARAGNPPQNEYAHYPNLHAAYQAKQISQQEVEQTGFQQMPKEAYQEWLKSLDYERQKQESKLQQERLEREIKKLKNLKSTLSHSSKK